MLRKSPSQAEPSNSALNALNAEPRCQINRNAPNAAFTPLNQCPISFLDRLFLHAFDPTKI